MRGISAIYLWLIAWRRRIPHARITSVHTIDACTVFRTRYITVHPSRPLLSTLRVRVFLRSPLVCPTSFTAIARSAHNVSRAERIENPSRCIYLSPAPRHHETMTHFALRPFPPLFLHRENLRDAMPAPFHLETLFRVLGFLMGIISMEEFR